MDKMLLENLVCPKCKKQVELRDESFLQCKNSTCNMKYHIRKNIPVMLIGGNLANEESGYYPKIKGGTMEDNPNKTFREYDSKIRTHYLRKYIASESRKGLILDVCCSKAPFYGFLKEWGYAEKVFGVDLLFDQLEIAYDRGIKAAQANALHIPFRDNFFSTVIFTDAMVHLLKKEDQEGVLNEIARVLDKDGHLLMTATSLRFVALMGVLHDVNVLKSTDYCTYYSVKELVDLTANKYRLVRFDSFGFYPYLKGITKIPSWAVFFDRILSRTPLKKFGMVYFIKLKKK